MSFIIISGDNFYNNEFKIVMSYFSQRIRLSETNFNQAGRKAGHKAYNGLFGVFNSDNVIKIELWRIRMLHEYNVSRLY